MDELTAFITARLDEDEAGAWEIHHGSDCASCGPLQLSCDCGYPARALREVTAKRAILARYEDCLARMEDPEYSAMAANIERLEYEEWVLPALAAIWSDHGDYRTEWAPSAT